MAREILLIEGFDHGQGLDLWDTVYNEGNSTYIQSTVYRTGGNAIACERLQSTQVGYLLESFTTQTGACVIGAAVRWDTISSNSTYPTMGVGNYISGSDETYVVLYSRGDGSLEVLYRDNGLYSTQGTILCTSAPDLITANEWYYVEMKVYINNSGGYVGVWLDGVLVCSYSGDTQYDGNSNLSGDWDRVLFSGNSSTTGHTVYFDDIYVLNTSSTSGDTDVLGDSLVEAVFPDANGANSDWVGSDGNSTDNYQLVDETTVSTADYVESNTVNDIDTYQFAALSTAAGASSIYAVQARAYCQRDSTGSRQGALVCVSGATTDVGSTFAFEPTWDSLPEVWETDPNTGSAWTETNLNAAEFGVKVIS